MKEILKIIGLIMVGLLTALIIYPFLHEIGHSFVALLVGARITNFKILPIPFVECEVTNIGSAEQMFIGLGGIVFPFVLSMSLKLKWFWGWYANMILKCISIYSVILSIIATVLHVNEKSWQNEDIVQVLNLLPNCKWLFLVLLCLMCIFGVFQILHEKLITRCIDFFAETN